MSALACFPAPSSPSLGTWMTMERICGLTGCSPRSVHRYASERGTLTRELPNRGRNGRRAKEFLVETLPAALRAKIEAASQPKLLPAPKDLKEVAPLFADTAAPETVARPHTPLSPKELRLIELRWGLVELLLNYPHNRDKYKALRLTNGEPVTTIDLFAKYLVHSRRVDGKKVSRPTLFRWLRQYRQSGKPGLARKPNANRGQSSFFKRYPAAADLAKSIWLVPAAPADRAYRAILRNQDTLGIPDAELPSYATVRRYLSTIPQPIRVLAREGQRRWNETAAPHLTRDYTSVRPGTIYTSDHMIHDVWLRNDCFQGVEWGAVIRAQFTCISCLSSRKMVGYAWTPAGDSRSIVTAFRRAVERFGVPEVFYCDNGNDFKKFGKGAKRMRPTPESIREGAELLANCGALQQVGTKLQECLPYHPQSKNIERAFGFVHSSLDSLFMGYLTGNAYNKPDASILAGAEHKKLQKIGRVDESRLVPASVFIQLAQQWIEHNYNAEHKHSGQGMNKRTPNEVFEQGNPVAMRKMVDPAVLALMLLERRTAMVRRTAVTLNKQRYVPATHQDTAALYLANEQTVVVAFDPNDPSVAFALDQQGRALANLVPEQLAAHPLQPDAKTQLQIAEMSQTRGRLKKSTAIAIATAHEASATGGYKTDLQALIDHAKAAPAIDASLISQKQIRRATRPSDDAHAPASSFDIATEIMEMLA